MISFHRIHPQTAVLGCRSRDTKPAGEGPLKEIRATNANLCHVKQKDGTFDPRVEVILIVSEP